MFILHALSLNVIYLFIRVLYLNLIIELIQYLLILKYHTQMSFFYMNKNNSFYIN